MFTPLILRPGELNSYHHWGYHKYIPDSKFLKFLKENQEMNRPYTEGYW